MTTTQTVPPFSPNELEEPYSYLEQLRTHEPIHYSEVLNGWVFTRYVDVADAFRHPDFTSDDFETQVRNQLKGHDIEIAKDFLRIRLKMMLHKDGETHLRLRRACNMSFGKKGINAFVPLIQQAVTDHVNLLPTNQGWDFAIDFAEPLSTRVIADLFNVPYEDREHFQKCSDDVSRFFGNSVSDAKESALTANYAIKALEDYFDIYYKEREKNPGNDLLSFLIQSNHEGLLTKDEVISQCVLVMMAGHFTVIDQLCNSFNAFVSQNIWPTLVKDVSLIPSAIEESIRFDGSVLFMARTVSKDTLFKGINLKKNDTVFLGMGAANRDPSIYNEPDNFIIEREKTRHLGFGYGAHQCIGLGLARIEMAEAFTQLVNKFPNLQFADANKNTRKCESLFFRGFYSMPVIQPIDS